MGMVVRTNTMALNAYRQLGMNNSAVSKSLEKLSSGFRINRAGDDAAGLAISEKMKAQIKGLETASSNAQDGISLIQTAEGNLGEVHDMLNRMVELATKSANGTYTDIERRALQDEMDQLLTEIDRISKSANFNGTKLLDGSLKGGSAIDTETLAASTDNIPSSQTYTPIDASKITFAAGHTNGDSVKDKKEPKFSIDLAEIKVNLPKSTGLETYSVSLGGISGATIQLYNSTALATNAGTNAISTATAYTAAFSMTAGSDAVQKSASEVANLFQDTVAVIGNDVFQISVSGTKLTFNYQGQKQTDGSIIKSDADGGAPTDSSLKPTGDLTVTVTDNTSNTSVLGTGGRFDCHITDITDAQKQDSVQRAGATLTLSPDMIEEGKLKIGDTVFVFSDTTAAPTNGIPTATNGATITIGIKGFGTNTTAMLQSVTEQMSHCSITVEKDNETYTFRVGRGNSLDKIEIEETVPASGKDYGKFTEDELKKVFQHETTTQGTKGNVTVNLGTKDGNLVNIKDGNVLTVDGTDYKFVKKTTAGGSNEILIGENATDTYTNLQTALQDTGNYTVTLNTTANTLMIEQKDDARSKPTIEYTANTDDMGVLTLQIGDTADSFNKMGVKIANMGVLGLGLNTLRGSGIMTEPDASDAIDTIKNAINTVSAQRASLGALQNRLEHTINNLDVAAENLSSANSRIRDTDMAKEMMNYTKMNVLVQSAQAMLAQANQQPQSVLQLLQ